jgi:hypothetical protein
MGKVAAGLINNVAGALKAQMTEAAEQSQDCYDAATRAVANDARVRRGDRANSCACVSRHHPNARVLALLPLTGHS